MRGRIKCRRLRIASSNGCGRRVIAVNGGHDSLGRSGRDGRVVVTSRIDNRIALIVPMCSIVSHSAVWRSVSLHGLQLAGTERLLRPMSFLAQKSVVVS